MYDVVDYSVVHTIKYNAPILCSALSVRPLSPGVGLALLQAELNAVYPRAARQHTPGHRPERRNAINPTPTPEDFRALSGAGQEGFPQGWLIQILLTRSTYQ